MAIEQAIEWKPTAQDQQEFAEFKCTDTFPLVSNQVFFACDDQGYKYMLGPEVIPGEQVDTAARTGRNPQTGAEIKIPAGKRVKVTAGSKLKAAVK